MVLVGLSSSGCGIRSHVFSIKVCPKSPDFPETLLTHQPSLVPPEFSGK